LEEELEKGFSRKKEIKKEKNYCFEKATRKLILKKF